MVNCFETVVYVKSPRRRTVPFPLANLSLRGGGPAGSGTQLMHISSAAFSEQSHIFPRERPKEIRRPLGQGLLTHCRSSSGPTIPNSSSASGGLLGPLRLCLGHVGASWGILGPSRAILRLLGRSWTVWQPLGALSPLGYLGVASSGPLGCSWWPLGTSWSLSSELLGCFSWPLGTYWLVLGPCWGDIGAI